MAQYHALSYSWGTNGQKVTVRCNGEDALISQTLADALQNWHQIEFDEDVEYLWVDQLCINQADLDERNNQVELMRRIYADAYRTIIWLSDFVEYKDSKVLQLVKQLANIHERGHPLLEDGQVKALTPKEAYTLGLPLPGDEVWACLRDFLSKPWFSRVWVTQEAVLSHREPLVRCGNVIFEWDWFARNLMWLHARNYVHRPRVLPYPAALWLIGHARLFKDHDVDRPAVWSLEAILLSAQGLQATEPRDCIYALLGLAWNGAKGCQSISVDYRRPVYELYADVVRYCIEESTSLRVLGLGGFLEGPDLCRKAPSWVPRWDLQTDFFTGRKRLSHTLLYRFVYQDIVRYSKLTHYNAGLDTKPCVTDTGRSHELALSGLEVGRVAWCSDTLSQQPGDYTDNNPMLVLWEKIVDKIASAWQDLNIVRSVGRSFYMILVNAQDENWQQARPQPPDHFWAWLAQEYDRSGRKCGQLRLYKSLGQHGDADKVKNRMWGLKAFMTGDGRLGCGTAAVEIGDALFVLFGGDTAYALRHTEEGAYRFLGEAYVNGIMEGQAIERWRNGDLQEQITVLR